MNDKQVPYVLIAPVVAPKEPRGLAYYQAKIREAIFQSNIREAIFWFRRELNSISMPEDMKRTELRKLIRDIDQHARRTPRDFIQTHLDAYLLAVEMARRNPRCNGYRSRMAAVAKDGLVKFSEFIYAAGVCRGDLMRLSAQKTITDAALERIEDYLPE